MCFSTEASFASGTLISLVGAATLPQVRDKREVLLASLPLLFGLHQFAEGLVWLMLEHRISPTVGQAAKWFYIFFAEALLPTLSPLSLLLIEPSRNRRRLLAGLAALGFGLSIFAFVRLLTTSVEVRIVHHSVEYQDAVATTMAFAVLYVIATCGPLLAASDPWIVTFGVLNLVALLLAALFKALAFTSVWCAVAAMLSVFIFLHFRRLRRRERWTSPDLAASASLYHASDRS
jgi:hypothetical protein